MGVTVVCGRSGSGKSRCLMKHIEGLIRNPLERVLVVVPGQLTFETEKRIMRDCGVEGIFGLQVTSLQRLALRVIEDTGACEFVTSAERAMLASRALAQMEGPFHGADTLPEFETCAADLIARLKGHRQTPLALRRTADGLQDSALRRKLMDSAALLENYDRLCGSRTDIADAYAIAAERAGDAAMLRGAHLVIDGLDAATPAVLAFLTAAMALSKDTVAAFRASCGGGDEALFEAEERIMRRFMDAARTAGQDVQTVECGQVSRHGAQSALSFLEAYLYKYPYAQYAGNPDSIVLSEAQTPEEETDALCADILREVSGGRRFREIAVMAGGLDGYLPLLKVKFAQSGIPYFVDERRALSDNAFFDFVYSALCAAAGDATAAGAVLLSLYSPLNDAERGALDACCRRYGYQGWHLLSGFRRGGDVQRVEALRARAAAPLLKLGRALEACSAAQAVEAVRAFLKACGAQKKLEAFCAALDAAETRTEHAYFAQVYERIDAVLDGIARAFGDARLLAQTLCSLFKTGCDAAKIALIPASTDAVALFDVATGRLPDIGVLFALGVQDGVWPARDDGPSIFSAGERATLSETGLSLGVFDMASEKLKVYSALVKPKERLYISCHAQSAPAIVIDRIKRLFPGIAVRHSAPPAASLSAMRSALLGETAAALRGKPPAQWLPGLLAQQLVLPGWEAEARAMLLRDNAALPLGAELAATLYGTGSVSATRVESFCRCPFKHFLDSGLRVRTERDYAHDALDIGTYLHLALSLYTQGLLRDGADMASLTADEAERRMRAAAAQAAEQHDYAKLLTDERFARQYALLTDELLSVAQRIRKHFEGSRASVYATEQAFQGYTLATQNGEITLSGKIDRIDVADGWFRVVDYKSSDTDFDADDAAAGVSLQLPVYIEAAQRLLCESGLQPSGGYYMRIGDGYADSPDKVDAQARMTGISIADAEVLRAFSAVQPDGKFRAIDRAVTQSGTLDARSGGRAYTAQELDALLACVNERIRSAAEAIFSGETAIAPVVETSKGDVCAYCDYKSICRKDTGYAGNTPRVPEAFSAAAEEGGNGETVE